MIGAPSSGADLEFGQVGPQLLRLKVADVVKQSHASEFVAGVHGLLKGPVSFCVLMLKYVNSPTF